MNRTRTCHHSSFSFVSRYRYTLRHHCKKMGIFKDKKPGAAISEEVARHKFAQHRPDVQYMMFGNVTACCERLSLGIQNLTRSMEQECTQNNHGKYAAEYEYVVCKPAVEEIQATTGLTRDFGHQDMDLNAFCQCEMAQDASLTLCEVTALRLYTGTLHHQWNDVLRNGSDLGEWATCIRVLISAIIKLSRCSEMPETVYRRVCEESMDVPSNFFEVDREEGLSGVERGFMSVTTDPDVSEGFHTGNIFQIVFNEASRGADLVWVSQYPEEKEYVFLPCTRLSYQSIKKDGKSRVCHATAKVATMLVHTDQITDPSTVYSTDNIFPVVVPNAETLLHDLSAKTNETMKDLVSKKKLDFSQTQLELADVNAVLYAVQSNPRLTNLDTRSLVFSGDAGKALQATVLRHPSLLTFSGVPMDKLRKGDLREVNLHGQSLGDSEGLLVLAELVAKDDVMTKLVLSGNKIGDVGVAALLHAIRMNESVRCLHLFNNCIGDAGCASLANALKVNSGLHEINLRLNKIGDSGLSSLANAFHTNISIPAELCLGSNQIGDEGCKVLGDTLKVNLAMTSLSLSSNQIGDAGCMALIDGLKDNSTLTQLELDRNKLTEEVCPAFTELLQGNSTLGILDLLGNEIEDEEWWHWRRKVIRQQKTNLRPSKLKGVEASDQPNDRQAGGEQPIESNKM